MLTRIADLQVCLAVRFLRREASPSICVLFVSEVRFNFLAQIRVFLLPLHEAA
jgi:hypothetical protein